MTRSTGTAPHQPYAELGLTADEYDRITAELGREPTDCELAMYAVMWSEHCSYKSSRLHLRRFADLPAPPQLLAGIGANAGVIDVGGGLAVTFKVESHNHPSFVEPYQGAATGVGGIIRDVLAMGARPVAVMDSLRFGEPGDPASGRLVAGVVAGVGGYGNCIGLPNIGGELGFDPCYAGNPLVNALCVGVLPADRVQHAKAAGDGNVLVLLGARTGRDGIGGVSVLASATFADEPTAPSRRPSVQVGDPFTGKVLVECTLELFERDLVVAVQDLGGAGLTCALAETAAAGGVGMRVELDTVPLREPSMAPFEVLTSESQERMLAVVRPADLPAVLACAGRWGVAATAIGRVTTSGRLEVRWHGVPVADVPPRTLADGPVYDRPRREPAALADVRARPAEALPRPRTGPELRAALLALAGSPELADRSWVTEQYDRYVLGRTVAAAPHDAGIVLLTDDSSRAVALSLDAAPRFAALDPYAGAQLALAEAARNVAAVGATPVAVTDCLNFGSPEDPEVMWQFTEAVRGLADGCRELALPICGGNVSLYNQTGASAIHPTPVVGVLGLLPDASAHLGLALRHDGDELLLAGETAVELSGSAWAWVVHRHLGGRPPRVDFAHESALHAACAELAHERLATAAHDLSGGGLAQALVEACLAGGRGARVELPAGLDPAVALFAESSGRVLLAVPPGRRAAAEAVLERRGVEWVGLGVVGGRELAVSGLFGVDLETLGERWRAALPSLLSTT